MEYEDPNNISVASQVIRDIKQSRLEFEGAQIDTDYLSRKIAKDNASKAALAKAVGMSNEQAKENKDKQAQSPYTLRLLEAERIRKENLKKLHQSVGTLGSSNYEESNRRLRMGDMFETRRRIDEAEGRI